MPKRQDWFRLVRSSAVAAGGASGQSVPPAPPLARGASLGPWILGGSASVLALLLALPAGLDVWSVWLRDYRFAHGPFLFLTAAYLLLRSILRGARSQVTRKEPPQANARTGAPAESRKHAAFADGIGTSPAKAAAPGAWGACLLLLGGAALSVASAWMEVEALGPPALLLLLAGTAHLLGGGAFLRLVAPSLGLLAFALPWPTTLVKSATYSIQMLSALLTASLAPLAGLEILREGVTLSARPAFSGGAPYTVIVGPGCAGMKYLLALLSLAYLAAYFRGLGVRRGALLMLAAVPLALFGNALRILLILGLGAQSGGGAAAWAHEHLGWTPFLVACAGLAWLLRRLTPPGVETEKTLPDAGQWVRLAPSPAKLLSLNAVFALTLFGSHWGGASVPRLTAADPRLDRLKALPLDLSGWESEPVALSAGEQGLLRPAVARIVRFHATDGRTAELAVIGGYHKEALHPSGHGLAGPGWRMLTQETCRIPLARHKVPALRARMSHPKLGKREVWVTWCFTDGREITTSRSRLRWLRLRRKLEGQRPLSLLVRVIEPAVPGEAPPRIRPELGRVWLPAILAACRF